MIVIDQPKLEFRALEFASTSAVRGTESLGPPAFLNGRIELGGPIATALTPNYLTTDADLRAFVEGEAGRFSYHLVHLAVTFAAEPERPRLERAAVELTLTAEGAEPPIAWSMVPTELSDTSTVSTELSLAPKLKFEVAGTGFEAEPGSVVRTAEHTRSTPFLAAAALLSSTPEWRFTRTKATPLRGMHRLAMIVRAPWSVAAELTGRVTGSTRHSSFLRPEEAPLPWPLRFRTTF